MANFLHITNGDSAANILKKSHVKGDVLPWRDPMHHGPFPAQLDLDEVSDVRARYLTGDSDDGNTETTRDFRLRNECLRAAVKYDEVVLWFEHDLLDQLQILQILDWFGNAENKPNGLAMICIDSYEGIELFRGIGQLNCDQMASLFNLRQPVTSTQIQLAEAGWAAFRSPNPEELESFMAGNLEPLPFLHAALFRHLQEYPWFSDGLTRTERQILTLVSKGVCKPGRIFAENMELESVLFIGDWPTYTHIGSMCNTPHPLLECEPNRTFQHPYVRQISSEEFREQKLSLTAAGKQLLSGQLRATDFIERDFWLGGVHLKTGQSMWVWDADSQQLKIDKR